MKLGFKEAAKLVAEKIHESHMDPQDAHAVQYLTDIAKELSMDPSAHNLQRISDVLRHHDVEIHRGHEYPKYIGKIGDRDYIANDEGEETEMLKLFPKPGEEEHA